jgi:GTP 3',8-cyclase
MQDNFGRDINYLRVSVIDRCNLNCLYCMPEGGVPLRSYREIISFEEIAAVVKVAVAEFGFKKVRLTGGEPLMRRDIVKLVAMLAAIEGLEEVVMTTNGILLKQYAVDLARAGLARVNISLDSIDEKRFAAITRGGNLLDVYRGIDAALAAGLTSLKINCVIAAGQLASGNHDGLAVQSYVADRWPGVEVRFIQQMDFVHGDFAPVIGGVAGECRTCNRLRLLSDGKILPCLFSDQTFDVRHLGAREALLQAIKHKPKCGLPCAAKWMVSVGG